MRSKSTLGKISANMLSSLRMATRTMATAAFALALSSCSGFSSRLEKLQPPQVELANLALARADLLNPVFRVGLRVMNPNPESLHIEGADAVLKLNGKTVAKGRSTEPLVLKPRHESPVEIEATAKTLALAAQLFQLDRDGQIAYAVEGHLQLTKWLGSLTRVPFRLSGSMTREQLLHEIEGFSRR